MSCERSSMRPVSRRPMCAGSAMSRGLDLGYWREAVARLLTAFQAEHQRLGELDGAIGDGDHGTSMVLGFREAARRVGAEEPAEVGALLRAVGAAFTGRVG